MLDKLIVIYTDCKENVEELTKKLQQSFGFEKAHFVTKNPLIKGEAIKFLPPLEYEDFIKKHKNYIDKITKEFCHIKNTNWEYISIGINDKDLSKMIKGKIHFQANFINEISNKKDCFYLNGILHKIDWLALKIAGRTIFHNDEKEIN